MSDYRCPLCEGRGYLEDGVTPHGLPATRTCKCLAVRDLVRNLDRGWRGLSEAPRIASSPLLAYTERNLFLTASDEALRAHLRFVALRKGAWWGFKVRSDADLMMAWLSPIALVGKEILDADAASVSTEKATLVDLIDPPELLIVRLGVKSARNSAMPEVLLETLYHRDYARKPTWVVDSPTRRFDAAHLAFSDEANARLRGWDRLAIDAPMERPMDLEMLVGRRDSAPAFSPSESREDEDSEVFEAPVYENPAPSVPSTVSVSGGTKRVSLPAVNPKKKSRTPFGRNAG